MPGIFVPPFLTKFSANCKNLIRSSGSILGKAFAPESKKLLTSLQPVSTNAVAKDKNASLSSPTKGNICSPRLRHSKAKS